MLSLSGCRSVLSGKFICFYIISSFNRQILLSFILVAFDPVVLNVSVSDLLGYGIYLFDQFPLWGKGGIWVRNFIVVAIFDSGD